MIYIDKEIHEFSYETLANRLRELSFLNKGIILTLIDKRKKVDDEFIKDVFESKDGLKEFIRLWRSTNLQALILCLVD